MPPQVGRAGDGAQVIKETPEGVETKSSSVEKKSTERSNGANGASQDPKVAAREAQGQKQKATEQKNQKNMQGQFVQKNLEQKLPATDKKAEVIPDDGLKKGETITAKVTDKQDGFHFQFPRALTKEQAAALIFQNGKVPDGAKLVQDSGNSWIVQIPNDIGAKNNTAKHFNSHTETVITPPRLPTDPLPPESHLFFTWTGGASKTSSGPKRLDLKNDMGFTINKKYTLDEGQRSTNTLGQMGTGYELGFEKPTTKDEVMDRLFDKNKITSGEVRLTPMTPEPSTKWKVEVIGPDALTAFKRKAFKAFSDSSIYGNHTLPTGTPDGVRTHVENKTVPQDAVHHKPDVYVWEQDGYMMYVKTNKKGKDGYYEPQITKMPDHEEGKIWMNYYMKEKGMAPREAWRNFWDDTVEVTKMQIGMISGAARAPHVMRVGTPKSSFGDVHVPPRGTPHVTTGRNVSGGARVSMDPPPASKPIAKPNSAHVAEPNVVGAKAGNAGEAPSTTKGNVNESKPTKTSKANRAPGSTAAEADPVLRGLDKRLKDRKDVAGDHVAEGAELGRDLPISVIKERLRKRAAKGDQVSAGLLKEIEEIQERQRERARELGLIP